MLITVDRQQLGDILETINAIAIGFESVILDAGKDVLAIYAKRQDGLRFWKTWPFTVKVLREGTVIIDPKEFLTSGSPLLWGDYVLEQSDNMLRLSKNGRQLEHFHVSEPAEHYPVPFGDEHIVNIFDASILGRSFLAAGKLGQPVVFASNGNSIIIVCQNEKITFFNRIFFKTVTAFDAFIPSKAADMASLLLLDEFDKSPVDVYRNGREFIIVGKHAAISLLDSGELPEYARIPQIDGNRAKFMINMNDLYNFLRDYEVTHKADKYVSFRMEHKGDWIVYAVVYDDNGRDVDRKALPCTYYQSLNNFFEFFKYRVDAILTALSCRFSRGVDMLEITDTGVILLRESGNVVPDVRMIAVNQ